MDAVTPKNNQSVRYASYVAFEHDKYYMLKAYSLLEQYLAKHPVKARTSLDVGCADGSLSLKLRNEFGFEPSAMDISPGAVARARKKGINAKVHDLSKHWPFAKNTFGLVVGLEIIEHLYDTDHFFAEAHRILKKDGVLLLSTPNLASLVNRARLLIGKYPLFVPEYKVGGAGHVRAYTKSILVAQLEEHGFEVIKVVAPNLPGPIMSRHMPQFLKRAMFKGGNLLPSAGSHIVLIARKR